MDQHSELKSRWGDLSRGARSRWLTLVAGTDEVVLKALHAEVMDLIRSLRSDSAGPMEDLLAQRVGMLWLQIHYFGVQVADATTRTPREQEFLAKRQTAAEKAYAEAILTLRDFQAGVLPHDNVATTSLMSAARVSSSRPVNSRKLKLASRRHDDAKLRP